MCKPDVTEIGQDHYNVDVNGDYHFRYRRDDAGNLFEVAHGPSSRKTFTQDVVQDLRAKALVKLQEAGYTPSLAHAA